ncbi:Mov34/MPN/PAD-1 family protein [Algiphilus aromaticivorans]|uniref:Mov34/MPN/PAD-1 family protein n=1 Tax=Algiphilus aromaticivorans TaxID=382454 RepID=UPI0018DE2FFB|nr:Mov34/MPN/PAD-1 family protein [Algiphilus aromaticivorans]
MPGMPGPLVLPRPGEGEAWILIEDSVVTLIASYRQRLLGDSEAGGVLLGYRRHKHLHVVHATTPDQEDARARFSFDRLDESHARIASKHWALTDRRCDYLGEWHTHPERSPTPSGIDRREWRKIYEHRSQPLLFWIEGTECRWIGLAHKSRLVVVGSSVEGVGQV